MGISVPPPPSTARVPSRLSVLKLAGPGLVVAATGIGSGDVMAATSVPGGSIPLLVGMQVMFGVLGERPAIVLGVGRILNMSRTTVNVLSDPTATAWVARSEKVGSSGLEAIVR